MKNVFVALCIMLFAQMLFASCDKAEKKHSCYDATLVHDGPCTLDCPGIVGCDGKTYRNECEAARVGIRPQ